MSRGCPRCGAENVDEARFCRSCGIAIDAVSLAMPGAEALAEPRLRVPARWAPWIVFGALALALAAGVIGWLNVARSNGAPTFDSSPPPSVLDALPSGAAPAQSVPVTASASAVPAPALQTSDAKPVPVAESGSMGSTARPISSPNASAAATNEAPSPWRMPPQRPLTAPAPAVERPGGPARDAQPRASTPPRPAPGRIANEAAAAGRQTVRDRCAGRNSLSTGICEARECMRAEHAAEAVCRSIKAADDRRREQ